MQSDVNGRFRCGVARREAIYIGKDVIDAERVGELAQVHLLQESADALDGLAQVGRHGGLSVAGEAVVFNLYLNVRRGGAGIGGHGKDVAQLKFVGFPAEFHAGTAGGIDVIRLRGIAAAHTCAGRQSCSCRCQTGTCQPCSLEELSAFHNA